MTAILTKPEVCSLLGCTLDQLDDHYKHNLSQLRAMRSHMEANWLDAYRGVSMDQLDREISKYEQRIKE